MSKQLPKKKGSSMSKGVIGIDEVGRGPLAGPVTVCAVYLEDEKAVLRDLFQNSIRDSKNINKLLRNKIYQTIRYRRYLKTRVEYALVSRSAEYIDKHGISRAIKGCLTTCMTMLERKGVPYRDISVHLDAGLVIPSENVQQESFIKGDERYVEIALASILAKEHRDAHMRKLGKIHPEYAWEENVGYGTKLHREGIQKMGITKYHRKTYLKAFKLFDKTD